MFTGTAKEGGLPQRSQPGYLDASWVYPEHKSDEATDVAHPRLGELHGVPAFEGGKFNPRFYAALSETIRERRTARTAAAASTPVDGTNKGVLGRFGLGRK